MNNEETARLRQLISSHILELEKALDDTGEAGDRKQKQSDDLSASMDLTISSAVETNLIGRTRAKLKRLKQNLNWLDSENAGYCGHCGCEIPVNRLIAVPTTRLCVDCAEKHRETLQ